MSGEASSDPESRAERALRGLFRHEEERSRFPRIPRYEIRGKLGEGAAAVVYRAWDRELDRDVALKVLPPALGNDPERLARFQREAQALAALDHPGIVTVYSVEQAKAGPNEEDVHFLTMQLVEGQSLDRVLPEGGFPVQRFLEIAAALSDALAAAHEKGIVHRDLKLEPFSLPHKSQSA